MYYRTSLGNVSQAAGLVRRIALSSLAAAVLALPLAGAARAQTVGNANFTKPRLTSNTKKYRDAGLPAATGRSGAASLTARALLGKDGQTSVELTTGALDSATPAPGQIVKAQLKPLRSNGEAAYARNFAGLAAGGTFNTTVNDLRRGQQVQAQANVTGIDPNRTDVVTVVETVKLRPDISAAKLVAPAQAVVNTPVNLTAVIRERNGDVGARANAVLYVNGAEADRADGLWVDANGTVSAAFTHTFSSEGAKQLSVRLERVTPADYDAADNAASASIEVVSPRVKLNYFAYALDRNYSTHYASDYDYTYDDGTTVYREASKDLTDSRSHTQDVYFYGWTYGAALTFPVSASVVELSDGAAAFSTTFPGIEADASYSTSYGTYEYNSSTSYRQDMERGTYIFVHSTAVRDTEAGYNENFTQITYARYAGDVTYHSERTYRIYYAYQGEAFYDYGYSYNFDHSGTDGQFVAFGSQYGLDVAVAGAGGTTVFANPRMVLNPVGFNTAASDCWSFTYEFSRGRSCYETSYVNHSKEGFAQDHGTE